MYRKKIKERKEKKKERERTVEMIIPS